jgi:hypothetical protein
MAPSFAITTDAAKRVLRSTHLDSQVPKRLSQSFIAGQGRVHAARRFSRDVSPGAAASLAGGVQSVVVVA